MPAPGGGRGQRRLAKVTHTDPAREDGCGRRRRMSIGVPRLRHGPRNFGWGFVDQAFSSITNLGLSVLVARLLGAEGLGTTFLGFAVYLLALGVQRALVSEPLVARSTTSDFATRQLAARHALSLSLLIGVVGSLLLGAGGLLLSARYAQGVIVFAPWLIPCLCQDLWRSVLFRDGRARSAALNDGIWVIVMGAACLIAIVFPSTWTAVGAWGAGAAAGALVGFVQTRLWPTSLAAARVWWRSHAASLGRYLLAGNILYAVNAHVSVFALVGVLGAADYGGARAVQSIFAPLTLLVPAMALPGLPAVSRALVRSERAAQLLSVRIAAALTVLTAVYVGVLSIGREALPLVFGTGFSGFEYLIVPVGIAQVLLATGAGFPILLTAQGRGRALFIGQSISVAASFAARIGLATAYGLTGLAWGWVIAGGVTTVVALTLAFPARPLALLQCMRRSDRTAIASSRA